MAYKLYYADGSASMCVRVILEELDQPYELIVVDISSEGLSNPNLLKKNPNGWIPVLTWEKGSIYECGAIVVFLCDRHSALKLAPNFNHTNRGLYLQWLFFFSSSLQTAYQMTYRSERFCSSVSEYYIIKERAITRLGELWKIVDCSIGKNEWLLGDHFSSVDIYLFMLTTWLSKDDGHPKIQDFPNVCRIAEQVKKRRSVQNVYQVT